ncbi:MAG: SLC13 family permease [Planctomycetota bacterium]
MMIELLADVSVEPSLTGTVLTAVSAIILLLVLILWVKLHAFIALILASYYVGIMSGMDLLSINESIKSGMGGILGFVATVVGLGAIFGKLLEAAGGAEALAYSMLRRFGDKHASWAMVFTGFLVSIPVFLDVALVILIPIVYALTKKTGKPLLYYGIPLLAGLAVTHAFVPPTPGPILVAEQLGANLGLVILFGVIIGIPAAILAGPVFGRFIANKIPKGIPEEFADGTDKPIKEADLPSFTRVFLIIMLPIVLILIQAVTSEIFKPPATQVVVISNAEFAKEMDGPGLLVIGQKDVDFTFRYTDYQGTTATTSFLPLKDRAEASEDFLKLIETVKPDQDLSPKEQQEILAAVLKLTDFTPNLPKQGVVLQLIGFFGHPFTALVIAVLAAAFFLASKQGFSREQIMDLSNRALAPAGIIILVTGAGGVFKQILIDSDVAKVMADALVQSEFNIVLLAFVISALVRVAQGSATVAMVTTAAVIAPLLPGMSELSSADYALITISIASGATTLSHVNDSGFWLVSKFFGLTEKETLMSWTVMETIISIVGLVGALILSYIF